LRQFRIAAGLSQEALAERARISLDTVGALERGRRQAPHRDTLELICEGLGLGATERADLAAAADASRRVGRPRINETGVADAMRVALPEPEAHHNLPYSVNSFRGREHDLGELTMLVRSRRLVTLHGAGGVGKTRLAIEAARAHLALDEPHDGAWFVDLGEITDPAAVTTVVAHTLGIRELPDEPVLETIVAALRDKRLLLVLDSCEHVVESSARLAERVTQACAFVRVIATSREALEIDGEVVYEVEPLALPARARSDRAGVRSLDELSASPAIELFLDRASDADPHFFQASAENDPEAVAQICERLDGLPLTLELAAARVRDLTLRDICAALDSRFELLVHGKRTAQPRHRTLRALLEWSYALLNENEQRIFRRLGVFAGSWTIDAAAAVCGDDAEVVRDAVALLVSKSLVTVVHSAQESRRFRLLESLRAFARTLLSERGEEADAARLHAEHYRDRALRVAAAAHDEARSAALDSVVADLPDMRAALEWSIGQRHDVVRGAELTTVLADAWAESGMDAEGLRLLDAATAALVPEVGPRPGPSLRIRDVAEADTASASERGVEVAPPWLRSFSEERTYRTGDVIFRAGDDARELLYIVSGNVRLEEIGLEVGARELLGEIAFFSARNRRTASARCISDVVVRSIGRDALLELYDTEPPFREYLIAVFTRRLLADLENVRRDRPG